MATARYVGAGGSLSVLYRGEVVESGPIDMVLSGPQHPYTQCLLSAVPVLRGLEVAGPDRLEPTAPLDDRTDPDGCRFAPRCPVVAAGCAVHRPVLGPGGGMHRVACHHPVIRRVVAVPLRSAGDR